MRPDTEDAEEHAAPDDADEPKRLADLLPGFDVEAAIRRLGSESLYRGVLGRFYETERDAMHRLRIAIENDDRSEAIRIVHTLKGLGATMGADELHRHAGRLETALNAGDTPADRLADTERAFDAVIDELARMDRSAGGLS